MAFFLIKPFEFFVCLLTIFWFLIWWFIIVNKFWGIRWLLCLLFDIYPFIPLQSPFRDRMEILSIIPPFFIFRLTIDHLLNLFSLLLLLLTGLFKCLFLLIHKENKTFVQIIYVCLSSLKKLIHHLAKLLLFIVILFLFVTTFIIVSIIVFIVFVSKASNVP